MDGIGALTGTRTTVTPPKTNTVTLQDLQKQYPHLKMSAQAFSSQNAIRDYAMKQSGKYNVAIDPRAIARMGEDGEFSNKIHETLAAIKEGDDYIENYINSHPNTRFIACGTIIDKDGNASGWAMSESWSEGEGMMTKFNKSRQELQDRLEATRQKKREEARKLEQKKQEDKAAEALEVSLTVERKTADSTLDVQA